MARSPLLIADSKAALIAQFILDTGTLRRTQAFDTDVFEQLLQETGQLEGDLLPLFRT
jgi:hypothetical protein